MTQPTRPPKPIKPQEPPKTSKKAVFKFICLFIFGGLLACGSMAVGIWIYSEFAEEFIVLALAFCFAAIFGIVAFVGFFGMTSNSRNEANYIVKLQNYNRDLKKYNEFVQKHPHYDEIQFYQLCRNKYKINLSEGTKAVTARMKRVADELGLSWSEKDLITKYHRGQAAAELQIIEETKVKHAQKKASLLGEQKTEDQQVRSNVSIKFFGRSKRWLFYEKRIAELKKQYEKIHGSSIALMTLSDNYRKSVDKNDSNWAIAGGIAQGIAGPAAGAFAASEAYKKGEKERQSKLAVADQLNTAAVNVALSNVNKENHILDKIEEAEKNLEITKQLLSSEEHPQNRLMDLIKPRTVNTTTEVPGLIRFDFVTNAASIKIYDTVDAYIDGYFKVIVKRGGSVVFERYFSLPDEYGSLKPSPRYYGYVESETANALSFDFQPVHLWGIENK